MESRTTRLDPGEPGEDQVPWGGRGCYERATRQAAPHSSLLPGTSSVSYPQPSVANRVRRSWRNELARQYRERRKKDTLSSLCLWLNPNFRTGSYLE